MGNILHIGDRLRAERERLGLNQTEFAERAGVTRKTLFGYESGERSPSADALAAWAMIGLDVLFVVTGSRSCAPPSPISSEHEAIIRDYEASSPDGKEAIRRLAAATALGAAVIQGGRRSRSHGSRKYLGASTHQEFHESAPVVGQVVTTKPKRKKS
ncbi:helix-turn-helix domain-containing protein [Achromobacter denitrificans]|uniref:helix-turn-helix domain-containing protein n=1 Tax=Achromobacter denitrificans TaxID=32002 RepID=UPI003CD01B90